MKGVQAATGTERQRDASHAADDRIWAGRGGQPCRHPPGAQACYARTYDKAHLAEHPKQKVTEMIFSLRYTTLGEDEAHLVATEEGGVEKQYFDYDFTLAAR